MRPFALALAVLAAVAWSRPVSAAAVAADLVLEQQAQNIGERDVWGLWLRTTDDVQLDDFPVFVNMNVLESVEFDVTNPDLNLDDSFIGPDILGESIPLLYAFGQLLSPLIGPAASGRIATLTGRPLQSPPHVIVVPGLIPFENVYDVSGIYPTNGSGSPLSILSLSGPNPPFCEIQVCEIPVVPRTYSRWLWAVPEPGASALVAVTLALLALRRRA